MLWTQLRSALSVVVLIRASKKSLSELIDEIRRRDDFDSNRGHSPLKKASDAIEIDTTDLSIDEQVKLMLGIVKQKIIGNKK